MAPPGNSLSEIHESSLKATKLKQFFGGDFFDIIKGKTVLDFGCGAGRQAVEMALMGADRVIGLDRNERLLSEARKLAQRYSMSDRCTLDFLPVFPWYCRNRLAYKIGTIVIQFH
jgi:2-polyprenyl-3-methyl-5-hydroxy-6-metoxy-1,4-benzoquinol methylase